MARLKDIKYDDKRDKAWCKNLLRFYKEIGNRRGCYDDMRFMNKDIQTCYEKGVISRKRHANESFYQNMSYWEADASLYLDRGAWYGKHAVLMSTFLENHSKGLDRTSKLKPNDFHTLRTAYGSILNLNEIKRLVDVKSTEINQRFRHDSLIKACDLAAILTKRKKSDFNSLKKVIDDMIPNRKEYASLPF